MFVCFYFFPVHVLSYVIYIFLVEVTSQPKIAKSVSPAFSKSLSMLAASETAMWRACFHNELKKFALLPVADLSVFLKPSLAWKRVSNNSSCLHCLPSTCPISSLASKQQAEGTCSDDCDGRMKNTRNLIYAHKLNK